MILMAVVGFGSLIVGGAAITGALSIIRGKCKVTDRIFEDVEVIVFLCWGAFVALIGTDKWQYSSNLDRLFYVVVPLLCTACVVQGVWLDKTGKDRFQKK